MVQRDQWDTYRGPKKIIFLIRDIDGLAMTAAPVESCQSLPKRCPWGRLGSVLYMVSRLHRMRRRIQHILANSLSMATHLSMNYLAMASRTPGGAQVRRMRHRRLHTTRPTPRDLQEPIRRRKKRVIWTRWRPVPDKNVNYSRAPSSRRSGLFGPHATPPIVNYNYRTSTPREGYFGLPTLGT